MAAHLCGRIRGRLIPTSFSGSMPRNYASATQTNSRRTRAALLLMSLALASCGGGSSASSDDPILDYCSYGAVSQAQLDGCIEHVPTSQVNGLDTDAARYAKGQLDRCLSDSGPFCQPR